MPERGIVLTDDQREDLADTFLEALVGIFDHTGEQAYLESVELRDAAVAWLMREGIVCTTPPESRKVL